MVTGQHVGIGRESHLPQQGLSQVLERVRTLVKNDRKLSCDISDEFLLRFIKVCGCHSEKSYELIISYFRAKRENPEEFLFASPSKYVEVLSRLDLGFVSRRADCDGRPLLFLRFGNIDPSTDSWGMLMQSGTLVLESLSLEAEVQESGLCLVLDCTNFSLKIMKWATPSKLKALMQFFQESVPVRFDYVHIVNAPLAFKIFYAAISPFVGEEFVSKLVWHKSPYKALLSTLGPSNTPTHLGGNLNVDDMKNWYQDMVLDKEHIFQIAMSHKKIFTEPEEFSSVLQEVPPAFTAKGHDPGTSRFGFDGDKMLVSFCP